MVKVSFTIFLAFIICLIGGCSVRGLTSNGKNVALYAYPPKSCQFLGYISNPNVHEYLDLREDKDKDHINYIKNEAAELGGNAVVITALKKTKVKRYYVKSSGYFMIERHEITAKAYFCRSFI